MMLQPRVNQVLPGARLVFGARSFELDEEDASPTEQEHPVGPPALACLRELDGEDAVPLLQDTARLPLDVRL